MSLARKINTSKEELDVLSHDEDSEVESSSNIALKSLY